MALSSSLSLRFLVSSTPNVKPSGHPNLPVGDRFPVNLRSRSTRIRRTHHPIIKAIEEGRQENELSETEKSLQNPSPGTESEDTTETGSNLSELELGSEIKKAMKARKEREDDGDLWSGVAEEIREIEWPVFGKVLGTTGVVLGVIAGSSVVLLTVNAVLAEFSDRVFAGKGVQDFLS
ncbi:hypothetical protein HHK36_006496 [Tetracentron sinense]|uniref:Preprotein translocase subunit SECE1 n=1 Tax=Tetracentron sinense TaxID=13715 RepID=A0A835DKW9_TETSI|nr:hypothetical protein HHK36_006496 [Tetracentron sinense]